MRMLLQTLIFLLLIPAFGAPSAVAMDELQPPDVFRLVTSVSEEMEQLRWFMGKPVNGLCPPEVSGVSPYEVYYQARTLLEKANRLSFEVTQERSTPMPWVRGDIRPADVYAVVLAVRSKLGEVRRFLGIKGDAKPKPRDASKIPTDVFKLVVQANRQLNLMLDRQFSPSDVFRQVTVAVGYAEAIHSVLAPGRRPPEPYPYTPGKQPVDVFQHLIDDFELALELGRKRGQAMLSLSRWSCDDKAVQPGDVYDVASILVAELAKLHSGLPGAPEPPESGLVFGKYPSDVCQRAGVLEGILKEILDALPE